MRVRKKYVLVLTGGLLLGLGAVSAQAEEKSDSSDLEAVSIIGGADEPTEIFLEGHIGRREKAVDFDLSNLDESQMIRDENGKIIGVEEGAFYSAKTYENVSAEELSKRELFSEYKDLGITFDAEKQEILFNGMWVVQLEDEYREGSVLTFNGMSDEELETDDKLVWLTAVRDEEDKLLFFTYSDSDSFLSGMSFDEGDWMEDGEVIDAEMDETNAEE